jgi:S-adenosylmethionine hydrolase
MVPLVTLTTDFGTASGYVAQMKGAFYRRLQAIAQEGNPSASDIQLIDLAHDLPPHDTSAAAWFVATSCFGFPAGTLHVVVVDPGVGTARPIVYAEIEDQRFLTPDNGLLSLAMSRHGSRLIRQVSVPETASATFHGRDVFAPVAAELASGNLTHLSPLANPMQQLPWPEPQETAEGLRGEIIHVDHFGNLITNLPDSLFSRLQQAGRISCGETTINTVVTTYGEAAPGSLVALAGSQGFLEIAVVQGRADRRLTAQIGASVRLA